METRAPGAERPSGFFTTPRKGTEGKFIRVTLLPEFHGGLVYNKWQDADHGRRVRIRFQPEIWTKWNGKYTYRRIRQGGVTVSCPNSDQAERVIEAINRILLSLDGKFLAR